MRALKFVIIFVLFAFRFFPSTAQNVPTIFGISWSNTTKFIVVRQREKLDIYSQNLTPVHSILNFIPETATSGWNTGEFVGLSWNHNDSRLAVTLAFEGTPNNESYGSYDYIIVYDTITWEQLFFKRRFSNIAFPGIFKTNSDIITIVSFESDLRDHVRSYDPNTGILVQEFVTDQNYFFSWNPVDYDAFIRYRNNVLIVGNVTTQSSLTIGVNLGTDDAPRYNSDGQRIALIRDDYNVYIYSSDLQQILNTIDTPEEILAVDWFGDNIVTNNQNNTLQIWDLSTGQSIIIPQTKARIFFNPQGTQVATLQGGVIKFYADFQQTALVDQLNYSSDFYMPNPNTP